MGQKIWNWIGILKRTHDFLVTQIGTLINWFDLVMQKFSFVRQSEEIYYTIQPHKKKNHLEDDDFGHQPFLSNL